MGRIAPGRALLAGLLLAAPASAGTGSELRAVIARAEQLRGLKTTHPLAVSTLDAAGLRRVVVRELARERHPRNDAAWDDALHLLGVLKRGQSLEQVQRSELTGQVAGLYVPHSGRLYVLGSGGAAPRSVIAHEVDARAAGRALPPHARRLRPAPARSRRRARGAGARRGRRHRRPVALRRHALARASSSASWRARWARSRRDPGGRSAPFLEARAALPVHGGPGLRARTAGARRAAAARPRLPPPAADDGRGARPLALPGRRSAGAGGEPAGGSYDLVTTFGAEDLIALTGQDGLARTWLGGRLGVGPKGLDCASRRAAAASLAAALERALPATRGGRVPGADRLRPDPAHKAFSAGAFPADRERRGAIPRAR